MSNSYKFGAIFSSNLLDVTSSVQSFTVKYFYKFLIDGGMRSPLYTKFWKIWCPIKISLFWWLVWDDKILTLSNLFKKGYNFQTATDTCILCHKASETVEYLFLDYEFSGWIWSFFKSNIRFTFIPSNHL